MNEETLKSCPFCGGEAEIERRGTTRISTIIACTSCGCRLENGEEWGYGRAWNTRVTKSSYARRTPQQEKTNDT